MAITKADLQKYWRSQVKRIAILLTIWAIVAFGMGIFGVEYLNQFTLNDVPFGFWMAQQGSIFIFVLIILFYAIASDRADRAFGLNETADSTATAGAGH